MTLAVGHHPTILQASGIITRSTFGLISPYLYVTGSGFTISENTPGCISQLVNLISRLFQIKHIDLFQKIAQFHIDHPQRVKMIASLREKLTHAANLKYDETTLLAYNLLVKCLELETRKPLVEEIKLSLKDLSEHMRKDK